MQKFSKLKFFFKILFSDLLSNAGGFSLKRITMRADSLSSNFSSVFILGADSWYTFGTATETEFLFQLFKLFFTFFRNILL